MENQQDMLGFLVGEENKYKLSDEEMIDLIITILYSGYETVSTTSMMAVKYLHDHPKVLEDLRVSGNLSYQYRFFFVNDHLLLLNTMYYNSNFAERTYGNKSKKEARGSY